MKSYDEIYGEMKEELARKSGLVITEGGDMSLRLAAVAAELESLWAQAEWTKKQCFPQYAAGEYLEKHAEMRGLTRGAAQKAAGVLRFETDEARAQALSIPSGTVCLNAAGVEFLTDEAATIAAGALYCTVSAKARETGTSGNAPAESICYMALAPVGITRCFNPSAFAGGSDGESDEQLRERVMESFKSMPNGSNRAYYESVALQTDGVAAATVVSRARGTGTVDIFISGEAGAPEAATIAAVQEKLAAEREICVDVEVSAPESVSVPVTVAIDISEDADSAEVLAAVKAALESYFDGRLLGKSVLLARLGSVVFGVEGVTNYSITAPSADVSIEPNQLPVAGTVTVSER